MPFSLPRRFQGCLLSVISTYLVLTYLPRYLEVSIFWQQEQEQFNLRYASLITHLAAFPVYIRFLPQRQHLHYQTRPHLLCDICRTATTPTNRTYPLPLHIHFYLHLHLHFYVSRLYCIAFETDPPHPFHHNHERDAVANEETRSWTARRQHADVAAAIQAAW